MQEKGKISFYRVSQCGFFKRGDEQSAFGSLSEMLQELQRWTAGKSLAATKTFEPVDGQDLHPAYLLDIRELNGTWLLSTWNQTPSTEAGVASVMADSNVGTPEIVMNDIEDGSIPGFATYFWFVPNRNIFASVRFQHLWTGQKSLQKYLESFLEQFSSHTVYSENPDADIAIIGYREVEDGELLNVFPRFRTALVTKPGQRDLIRQNIERIRKVIRKTTLQLNRHDELDQWQKFLRWTNIHVPQQRPDKVKVQYELNTKLIEADINTIIDDWDQGHEREWDDYGFVFKGQPQDTHWLSHSLARDEFELDIVRDNPEVINAQSLLQALNANSAHILRILE